VKDKVPSSNVGARAAQLNRQTEMRATSRFASVFGILTVFVAMPSRADHQVRSARQACAILKRGAVTHRLSVHDLTGRYYCDYYDPVFWTKEFIVLGLRYHDRAEERVGSNLVGWFGIRRRDGEIFEWNLEGYAEPLRAPSDWATLEAH